MDDMKEKMTDDRPEVERQGAISRAWNSIRTRFSLLTAGFLLAALVVFYVGGRIVLVHLVRDTEHQVREIGLDISRITYKNAERVKRVALQAVGDADASVDLRSLVTNGTFQLVAEFSAAGKLKGGFCRQKDGTAALLTDSDFSPYEQPLRRWTGATLRRSSSTTATGILRIRDQDCYVVMVQRNMDCLLFGMPFNSSTFLSEVSDNFGGMEIRVTNRKVGVAVRAQTATLTSRASSEDNGFGIAPMFSEALNFYSGGFWNLNDNPFEAVYAVRDIAGNAISMVAVSIPQTFSNVTRAAIGRLSFFVAMGGILFVLPLFWLQGRVLLNPLTKMTEAVARIGEHNADTDCPRLDWKGKDEFALLAVSVNRMLETISARAIAVAQTEARHQALIDCLPDALAIFDPLGRLIAVTKEAEGKEGLPGIRPGEIPDAAVYGRDGVSGFLTQLAETFRSGQVGKTHLKVEGGADARQETTTRHFELRITRMDEYFALVIWRDTTEEVAEHKLRLAAEQHALDALKRESLTGLAAGIAHDMNNVLSVVLNAAESEGADPSGDSSRTLSTIRDAVHRGSSMMRELMTFAGENKMTLMRVSPQIVMEDVHQLAVNLLGRQIELVFAGAEGAPDVDVDLNQFWKVLFNIVKNAGEAIGSRPGRIELSARPFRMTPEAAERFVSEHPLEEGDGVLFRIEDDGPGIRPDLLHRLFDPYVSSKAVGRGLGLATVRTIVEAHGGGICVKSAEEGGTVFGVFLPKSSLPATDAPAGAGEPAANLTGDILVVDDDESILKTSARLLKVLKLTPHVARDRGEALAVVRRHAGRLRAILLDANLGGIDTVRLLGAFRTGAPKVKIIVTSGSAEAEIEQMFKVHPYDDFLSKPYTIAELTRKICGSV